MIGTLRYNAEDGRRQMILVVPFMSPLAHSSHRAQQAGWLAGWHAYICDVLSPSVHLLYSPACMHACMRIYVTHVRLWFTPFYCTSTSVGHEKFIMHGCFLSHACIHSRFLQGLLPPHAINLLHSCDTVRPGPMQCRNHAALAAFCFLYAC